MRASIIVRIKNEKESFKKLLQILQTQTEQDFEVVVVDDNSIDGSDTVAFEYFSQERVQVVRLEREFNYAYASNAGARVAKGEYVVYVSAHSLPYTPTWLVDGLKHFTNQKVAGVYAMPIALDDATLAEKLLITFPTKLFWSRVYIEQSKHVGMMGATNAIFRKTLWEDRPFAEEFSHGGEDTDWAGYWIQRGYVIVHEPGFRVKHSHNQTLIPYLKQLYRYVSMLQPKHS